MHFCDKTFLLVPNIFTSWPLPWLLTYFWPKRNLGLKFSTKRYGTFILHILLCISCGMTFLFKPQVLTSWLDFWPTFEKFNLGHYIGNKRDRTETCSAFKKKENQFLSRLRSWAAHRDHFVRRLSVRCVCPTVTLYWYSRIAMFRRRTCIPRNSATICFIFIALIQSFLINMYMLSPQRITCIFLFLNFVNFTIIMDDRTRLVSYNEKCFHISK